MNEIYIMMIVLYAICVIGLCTITMFDGAPEWVNISRGVFWPITVIGIILKSEYIAGFKFIKEWN